MMVGPQASNASSLLGFLTTVVPSRRCAVWHKIPFRGLGICCSMFQRKADPCAQKPAKRMTVFMLVGAKLDNLGKER